MILVIKPGETITIQGHCSITMLDGQIVLEAKHPPQQPYVAAPMNFDPDPDEPKPPEGPAKISMGGPFYP